jgi:hypothetical protein
VANNSNLFDSRRNYKNTELFCKSGNGVMFTGNDLFNPHAIKLAHIMKTCWNPEGGDQWPRIIVTFSR